MRVDVWSDVVCPWCYIGKRRLESALGGFEHGDDVEVVWHSFELDPKAPARREGDPAARLAAKYGISREQATAAQSNLRSVGAEEGLDLRFDRSKPGNTFDAHRLLHLAADRGIQDRVKERFLAGYFTEGEAIGDTGTLARLAAEAGLDPSEVRTVLEGDKYADQVRVDEREAFEIGIGGVPFFVFDGKHAISGAQPPDLLVKVLRRAWADQDPQDSGDSSSCEGDSCAP